MLLDVFAQMSDGALAGALVKIATTPFECIITPLSTHAEIAKRGAWHTATLIYRLDGFTGFWRGALLDVARTGAARGLMLGIFDVYQHMWHLHDGLTGMLTGASVTLITYPLEVVQTFRRSAIISMSHSSEVRSASTSALLRSWALERGVRGLYPALMPSLFGYAGFWGIQFATKEPILRQTDSHFLAGFLGSAAGLTAMNWNNCIRLTMQRHAVEGSAHASWFEVARQEYSVGGVRRFYAGFTLRLFQTGFTMGLLFVAYDQLRICRSLCSTCEANDIRPTSHLRKG